MVWFFVSIVLLGNLFVFVHVSVDIVFFTKMITAVCAAVVVRVAVGI